MEEWEEKNRDIVVELQGHMVLAPPPTPDILLFNQGKNKTPRRLSLKRIKRVKLYTHVVICDLIDQHC